MKTWRLIGVVVLLLSVAGLAWIKWKAGAPRRASIQTLQQLSEALCAGHSTELLNLVSLPSVVQNRTPAEQLEFLTKALSDEISPEGLALLRREGTFGKLQELFPEEAWKWATQSGVKPEDCLAFKLERKDLRAEVVLIRDSKQNTQSLTRNPKLRIVRCNNVKQLAMQ